MGYINFIYWVVYFRLPWSRNPRTKGNHYIPLFRTNSLKIGETQDKKKRTFSNQTVEIGYLKLQETGHLGLELLSACFLSLLPSSQVENLQTNLTAGFPGSIVITVAKNKTHKPRAF